MTERVQYLLQIFEKIGAPLLSAIGARADISVPAEQSLQSDAKQTAELLSKSVQLSIDLGKMAGIETAPENEADRLRVALAALAGSLIAAQYKQTGRTPADADLKRITGALEAVLTFSENFTPDEAHIKALKELEANGAAVSSHQVNVQYLHLFTPVIEAVSRFSFGQQEKTLIRDIAGRLSNEAKILRKEIFGDSLKDGADKVAELSLMRTLAEIYALAHNQEVARLGGAEGDIKAVWSAFETRLSMLQVLGENLVPGASKSTAQSAGNGDTTPPPAPAAPPAAPPPEQSAPQEPPAQSAPPAAPASGNPMSFFGAKKPDAAGEPPAEIPPAAPPAAPPETRPAPPQEQPPAETSPPAAPEQPQEQPQEQPPKENGEDNSGDGGNDDKPPAPPSGGNPMSFFKKNDEEGS